MSDETINNDGCFQDETGKQFLESISEMGTALNSISADLENVENSERASSPQGKFYTTAEQTQDPDLLSNEDFSYQAKHSPSQPLNSDDIESPYSVYHGDDDEAGVEGDFEGTIGSAFVADLNNDAEFQNSPEGSAESNMDLRSEMRKGSTLDYDVSSPIPPSHDSSIVSPEPPLPNMCSTDSLTQLSVGNSPGGYRENFLPSSAVGRETVKTAEDADDDEFHTASVDPSIDIGPDQDAAEEEEEEEEEEEGSGGGESTDTSADGFDDDDNDASCLDDEWIDDDDTGYVYVPVSADEFEAIEEEASQQLLALQEIRERLVAEGLNPDDYMDMDQFRSGGRPPSGLDDDDNCLEEVEEDEEEEEEDEEEDDEGAYHDAYDGYENDLQAAEQYLQSQEQVSHIQLDQPESSESGNAEGEAAAMLSEDSPVRKAVQEDLEAAANRSFNTPMGAVGDASAPGTPSTAGFGTAEGTPADVVAAGVTPSFDTSQIQTLVDQGRFGDASAGAGAATAYSAPGNKARGGGRQTVNERRRSEIMGQQQFKGVDGKQSCSFNLKIVFQPFHTGFEEHKEFQPDKGAIIAGRYEVQDVLGEAAFSSALRCLDCAAEEDEDEWVCLKVIKNNKDFFDQSLDEIKLLQYINSNGDPDEKHVLRLIDFFYCQEHLFIVSELLRENLYEFGKAMREAGQPSYFTIPRLKKITKECLSALDFIHSLNLIHCDVKPENIVVKSYSRCEVKLIDFGSSCYTSDHLTTYIQSRSYRAPEVVLGCKYDQRIDVWSIGGVLAELYTGYVLFQNDSLPSMLARITGILGPFPEHVLQSGSETNKYFTLSNVVYEPMASPNAHNSDAHSSGYNLIYPKKTTLAKRLHLPSYNGMDGSSCPATEFDTLSSDDLLFLDFTNKLLNLDHTRRLTAAQALKHPWLADAGLNRDEYSYTHPDL